MTESNIKEDDSDPNSSLPNLLKAAGYDPDIYTPLKIEVTKVAYYNSSNGNADLMTNMRSFAATQVFEKGRYLTVP